MTKEESSAEIPITPEELKAYFMTLLDCPKDNENPNSSPQLENEMLDQPITEEEVTAAIQALKRNKAPGGDGLVPEIFKSFNSHLISFTTALFNKLLEQEMYPDAWSTGIIKPIYKKGDKRNPNNYRGITLLPVKVSEVTKEESSAEIPITPEELKAYFMTPLEEELQILQFLSSQLQYKHIKTAICLLCRFCQSF